MQADVDEPETGLGTLEDKESEPDWQVEQRDAPATLRKLRNSSTGDLHPVLPSRTRSGGQGGENESFGGGEGAGNDNALCCNVPREQTLPALLGAVGVKRSQISLESRRADHAIACKRHRRCRLISRATYRTSPLLCMRLRCPPSGRNGAADGRPDCAWCVEGRRSTQRKTRTRHQVRF